jgi:hypothetical protein
MTIRLRGTLDGAGSRPDRRCRCSSASRTNPVYVRSGAGLDADSAGMAGEPRDVDRGPELSLSLVSTDHRARACSEDLTPSNGSGTILRNRLANAGTSCSPSFSHRLLRDNKYGVKGRPTSDLCQVASTCIVIQGSCAVPPRSTRLAPPPSLGVTMPKLPLCVVAEFAPCSPTAGRSSSRDSNRRSLMPAPPTTTSCTVGGAANVEVASANPRPFS